MRYAAPQSLDEAVALLAADQDAHVLAGGHALLVEPQRSRVAQSLLVDLRRIPNLSGISQTRGGVRIAAMTTLAEVAADATIRNSYGVLADVAEMTGDPQLRNRATIGGSLASTDADNDVPAIAVILRATIEIAGPQGARTISADDFISRTARLGAGDIITALTLPANESGTGVAYQAHRNPATLTPICAAAVRVSLAPDGTIADSRVVIVGASERPLRVDGFEKQLAGRAGDQALGAAATAAEGVPMRSDVFASADYRKHLARVLTERALQQALERARG